MLWLFGNSRGIRQIAMSKAEAIQQMLLGKRVMHELFFSSNEWITMLDDSTILTEDGYTINMDTFWHIRPQKAFDCNWVEWKPIGL